MRIEAEQGAVIGTFHDTCRGAESGFDLAGRLFIAPCGPGIGHEGIRVAQECLHGFRVLVGQCCRREVTRTGWQTPDPQGRRRLLPADTGGTEDGVGRALDA